MEEHVSPRNFYNENGTLLIAKGVPISLEKLRQLERKYDSQDPLAFTPKYEQWVQKSRERYNHMNEHVLNQACSLLIDAIFESRQQPWSIHINSLSNYIDWIYTHSIDVALISTMIAGEAGYSEPVLSDICLGALLHDIGMLLIPKQLIQKSPPLSDTEKTILRQHSELGEAAIAEYPVSEVVRGIILQHHERLDGSGYPHHLKENQISDYAKIVMIADSFDGMTSGRPYKRTKGTEEALQIMRNHQKRYSKPFFDIFESIMDQN